MGHRIVAVRLSICLFTLQLKLNEGVEEEEAGEEVCLRQGPSRTKIARVHGVRHPIYWYSIVHSCIDSFLFLWFGSQLINVDEGAKALVGTVETSSGVLSSW